MRRAGMGRTLVVVGATLLLLGEGGCCAGERLHFSSEILEGASALSVLSGVVLLWVGSPGLARRLKPDACLGIGVLALAPTVICLLAGLWGYPVINIHFWTASFVFVLPALWVVAIMFLANARASRTGPAARS